MEIFNFNEKKYTLFPFDEKSNFQLNRTTGILTVSNENEVIGSCNAVMPLFAWQKHDFTDEDIMLEFAGNTDQTITEILSDLSIDVSEMNDFLIVRTV
jgi:hypothetical protein